MKWVAFLVAVAAIAPLSTWLRRNPQHSPKIWTLMGFLPFVVSILHLYMAIDSWSDWAGYVKGFEFSILDVLALALYFSLPATRHPLPFRFAMALYFVAAVLSAIGADVPVAALFYPWQLARMFLIYAVVTKACADPRVAPAILKGMAAGMFLEVGVTVWQRFGLGLIQAGGTFGHQNLLGLVSHFVVFPYLALFLAGRRGWLPPAVLLAGLITAVLTTSRATVGLAGMGYAVVFILSAMRQWTSRKALILLVGVVTMGAVVPLVVSSFQTRFAAEGASAAAGDDYDERGAYKTVATMMLTDHPMGVGANHYTLVANMRGYNFRAGVALTYSSLAGNVHNIYYLIAAETGYLGVFAFVLLLLQPLIVAFRCAWRYRGDLRGDLLLGLAVALLTVYIHSYFEWIFITFQAQYIFALDVGLVAGLAQQLGYWRRPSPRRIRLGAGAFSSIRPPRKAAVPGLGARHPTIVGSDGDRPNGLARR